MKPLAINPPLLNSANPWCTTLEQLQEFYDSPYTGAVTTRTSLLNGFPNDPEVHQFTFFNPSTHKAGPPNLPTGEADQTGSLNTLGYSPLLLKEYLSFTKTISDRLPEAGPMNDAHNHLKPFIISVTGTVEEVVECYRRISAYQHTVKMVLAMEINLSCPNIPDKPPPAYNSESLLSYLSALKSEIFTQLQRGSHVHVPIGIKTPPYTYHGQYRNMIDALLASAALEPKDVPCPVSFITATNTLGSSLLLKPIVEDLPSVHPLEHQHHTLNSATGTGIGGLAGAPLHPLALGNVYTIKGLLFQYEQLGHIQIIGVGGVEDTEGFKRMRAVGAAAVGVGTALGRKGVKVFQEIGEELGWKKS